MRENRSSTTERREPALRRPHVRGIGHPFGIRLISMQVALKQIRSYLCVWIAVRGDRASEPVYALPALVRASDERRACAHS
jgi:hypothetical protein